MIWINQNARWNATSRRVAPRLRNQVDPPSRKRLATRQFFADGQRAGTARSTKHAFLSIRARCLFLVRASMLGIVSTGRVPAPHFATKIPVLGETPPRSFGSEYPLLTASGRVGRISD